MIFFLSDSHRQVDGYQTRTTTSCPVCGKYQTSHNFRRHLRKHQLTAEEVNVACAAAYVGHEKKEPVSTANLEVCPICRALVSITSLTFFRYNAQFDKWYHFNTINIHSIFFVDNWFEQFTFNRKKITSSVLWPFVSEKRFSSSHVWFSIVCIQIFHLVSNST